MDASTKGNIPAQRGQTNAIGAQMVIDRFHPDAIIHTGIAGGSQGRGAAA